MAIFLQRIDSAPIQETNFSSSFESWITNLVDSLNTAFDIIQNGLNIYEDGLIAPSFTDVQIAAMAADLPDGVILYDTVNNEYVGKVSGTLMSFQMGAYP